MEENQIVDNDGIIYTVKCVDKDNRKPNVIEMLSAEAGVFLKEKLDAEDVPWKYITILVKDKEGRILNNKTMLECPVCRKSLKMVKINKKSEKS